MERPSASVMADLPERRNNMTMEQITPQTGSILHPATHMGAVTLAVADPYPR